MSNLDNLLDPNCTTTALNPTLFPVGTAQHMDITYNIFPFLCDLLKATTDNNFNPILADNTTPFDLTPYTDFSALTAIGDPRVSLGETMTQTYVNFLPRVITQTEVRQNGGTQVIDNYICNADGVPIKQSTAVPILLSLDLTGKKPYKYGAITIPPLSATYEQLMEPIHPNEVIDFVSSYMNDAKNAHSEDFVKFINTYFNTWTPEVDLYSTPPALLVRLSKPENNDISYVYIKYYTDSANKVACLLQLDKVNQFFGTSSAKDHAMGSALSSKIPDYAVLSKDKTQADEWYDTIIQNYKSKQSESYTNVLSNSSNILEHINKYYTNTINPLTANTFNVLPVSAC